MIVQGWIDSGNLSKQIDASVDLHFTAPKQLEHPLYRQIMQSVVALSDKRYSQKAREEQAERLLKSAEEYLTNWTITRVDFDEPDNKEV